MRSIDNTIYRVSEGAFAVSVSIVTQIGWYGKGGDIVADLEQT